MKEKQLFINENHFWYSIMKKLKSFPKALALHNALFFISKTKMPFNLLITWPLMTFWITSILYHPLSTKNLWWMREEICDRRNLFQTSEYIKSWISFVYFFVWSRLVLPYFRFSAICTCSRIQVASLVMKPFVHSYSFMIFLSLRSYLC